MRVRSTCFYIDIASKCRFLNAYFLLNNENSMTFCGFYLFYFLKSNFHTHNLPKNLPKIAFTKLSKNYGRVDIRGQFYQCAYAQLLHMQTPKAQKAA